jgi:hypothetical protein
MDKPDNIPQEVWEMAFEFQPHMKAYDDEVKNTAYAIIAGMVMAYDRSADIVLLSVSANLARERILSESHKLEPRKEGFQFQEGRDELES